MDVALECGLPIANGILTTDDETQAQARLDKGAEAVRVAVEMARLKGKCGVRMKTAKTARRARSRCRRCTPGSSPAATRLEEARTLEDYEKSDVASSSLLRGVLEPGAPSSRR